MTTPLPPMVYILAGNAAEASIWMRNAGKGMFEVRYVAQSNSLRGLTNPEFVVLPGFWKRTDAHDIWTVMQTCWMGKKFPYQYDGTEPLWAKPKPVVQTVAPPPAITSPAPPVILPPANPVTPTVNDNIVDIDTARKPRDVVEKVKKRFKKIQ